MSDSGGARPEFGEDVARLVAAVQDWARRVVPDSAIGHGGPECQWCPICQFVNIVRGEYPEVGDRIAEAGAALAAAVKSIADAAADRLGPGDGARAERPRPAPRVERINLDDPREP